MCFRPACAALKNDGERTSIVAARDTAVLDVGDFHGI